MSLEFLAKSLNNVDACFEPKNSHAATHFADSPNLKHLVIEIIETTTLEGEKVEFDVDMGRVVGVTDAVVNLPGDVIVYAKRLNRQIYTPFNKTQQPQPCSKVSVSFVKKDDKYLLHSAWIGSLDSPPMPGDENQTPKSIPYWTTHSLVWGSQKIQDGSETTECPW